MTPRIVVATAGRALRQLLGDRRTVALLLVVPGALLALTHQMVTQVVPVRVAITDPRGLQLLPGMNVTVRIHRS